MLQERQGGLMGETDLRQIEQHLFTELLRALLSW